MTAFVALFILPSQNITIFFFGSYLYTILDARLILIYGFKYAFFLIRESKYAVSHNNFVYVKVQIQDSLEPFASNNFYLNYFVKTI